MKRAFIDIKEGQVHYRFEGSGAPLLLLHQTAWSSEEYSRLIPLLAKSYWVIAMDTLGYGASDHSPREYEIPDYAKSVARFLDALRIERTNVFGHHTGSLIGVELAAAYPKRVEKLIVSGCLAFKTAEERLSLLNDDNFKSIKIDPYGCHFLKIWHMLRGADCEVPLDVLENCVENFIKAGVRGMEGFWAAFRYDTRARLPLIRCPTLAISGTKDVSIDHLDEIKSLVKRCCKMTIEGSGVFGCQTHPHAFAKAIREFLTVPSV
ncbi:alpha/beta fold hydrolase [Chloroflexota bacterium]